MKLSVRAIADAPVFSIDASGTLQINTTNTTLLGIAPKSFLLDLRGKVELLKVLKLDAGLRDRRRTPAAGRFTRDANLDFFGIAHAERLDLPGRGGQLRRPAQRPHGARLVRPSGSSASSTSASARRSLDRTPFGNTYIFELCGGARVEARVFGITLAGLGLDFSFTAQGAGRTKIELSVTVRIHLALRDDQQDGALHDRLPRAAAARLPRGGPHG